MVEDIVRRQLDLMERQLRLLAGQPAVVPPVAATPPVLATPTGCHRAGHACRRRRPVQRLRGEAGS
ncbi:hypothetical protein ACFQ4K_32295 [Tistrella bauzanensis]